MKKLILTVAAAALMSTAALAQTTVTTTTGTARAGSVVIEPEARTRIKTYVTEKKLRPVTTKERIVVGAPVPADVELVAVPSGPSLTKYRYVYSNDRVMLVDPGSRTVVQEID